MWLKTSTTLLTISLFVMMSFEEIASPIAQKKEMLATNELIIFVSDRKQSELESNYYDALIELRSLSPQDFRYMMVVSSIKELSIFPSLPDVSAPALIVYNKSTNQVEVQVSGPASVEEIVQPIDKVLSHENNKTPGY